MHAHHHDEDHHSHSHHSRESSGRRLKFVLALTALYMIAEAVGGWLSNSLALLSDAGHMLTDVAALGLSIFALWFSSRPITTKKTYGFYRLEILAALANGVALVVISLLIVYEAIHRLKNPESVSGFQAMLIAIGGLIVNGISAWLLHAASSENLNLRGAFLHIISDMLGSVGAIAAGLLIWLFQWTIADPIISMAMCLLIIFSAWQLIRESVNVLLEGTPSHIEIKAVIDAMHEIAEVREVHDLHVWTISSNKYALSAHVRIAADASYKKTLDAIRDKLQQRFSMDHVTIQIELPDESDAVKLYQIAGKRPSSVTH